MTLALSLSKVAARQLCFSAGTSTSSIYYSPLNVRPSVDCGDGPFPSNLLVEAPSSVDAASRNLELLYNAD